MKHKSIVKKLKLNKNTVANLLNNGMSNVKGGNINFVGIARTDTCSCERTVCLLSCGGTCEASACIGTCDTCGCTVTECQTQCPSGPVPCNYC